MEISLEQFNGPLDLLLKLIDDQEMDINEISLSAVTEQFLGIVETLDEKKPDKIADFLVIAAKLLLLKSRQLLPQFLPAEDDGPSLEDQLRLYKKFVQASVGLNTRWESGARTVFRVEPPRKAESFVPPKNLSLDTLRGSMVQLVHRLTPRKPLPTTTIDKAVSVKQKIAHIRSLLKKKKQVLFHEVLEDAQNKTEVIVGFLALLELMKQRSIMLRQQDAFADIEVQHI